MSTDLDDSSSFRCPHCGFEAGVYLVPRGVRTPLDGVRCLSCLHETPSVNWLETAIAVETKSQVRARAHSPASLRER